MIKSATLFDITDMPLTADLIKGQPFQAGGMCCTLSYMERLIPLSIPERGWCTLSGCAAS